jgi:transposase
VAAHKKNAERLGAHIVFIDESGFLLIPNVRRTWAPKGRTPVHRHSYRHEKVSVISGISVSPGRQRLGLYFNFHFENIGQEHVCDFLHYLLQHLRGHVIVIWDNGKPHKGKTIREFCRRFPRLHLEAFPPYAPELNPDEGVWNYAKRELSNSRPDEIWQLADFVLDTLCDLSLSQPLLKSCIEHSDMPPFLL